MLFELTENIFLWLDRWIQWRRVGFIVEDISWRYKLFKISFLTFFIFIPGCIVLPEEVSKNFQIQKSKDLKNLTQIFQICVLVEIKGVRNDILDDLYLHDKLPIVHWSPSWSFQSWPNSQILGFFRSCTVLSDLTGQFFDWNEWMMSRTLFATTFNNMANSGDAPFSLWDLLKLTKNDFICKVAEFCQLQRLLEWKLTVYPREFITN